MAYKRKYLIDKLLYCHEPECPGMWNEREQEASNIYHLLDNKLNVFGDCENIKKD